MRNKIIDLKSKIETLEYDNRINLRNGKINAIGDEEIRYLELKDKVVKFAIEVKRNIIMLKELGREYTAKLDFQLNKLPAKEQNAYISFHKQMMEIANEREQGVFSDQNNKKINMIVKIEIKE